MPSVFSTIRDVYNVMTRMSIVRRYSMPVFFAIRRLFSAFSIPLSPFPFPGYLFWYISS